MENKNNLTTAFYFLPGICYLTEFIVWSSFPQSHSLNAVLGGLWTLGQVGILLILPNLYSQKIAGGSKWKVVGVSIAAAGAISYLVNYVFGYWLDLNTRMFVPLGAWLSGIGILITAVQVIIRKRWPSINGKFPLIVGLYPFLVMFALLIITGDPELVAVMGSGIPWLLLGFGLATDKQISLNSSN
ncbi:hypothetical protein L0663_01400 [Dyadobacter sp. CY107]|uniref:hypothetical protein n=1 Tax=Dyadobacter fanqingshengii TaxID=2906443 RepID=UPI001F45D07F|nr:hypothetical protein [Dyadobacter fanqingshengii]MCF2502019.1 hypothetical protein [Dyadobacter fanqingshengii]